MRLLIKERVFSWSDTYDIYDEMGNVKYIVKAEIFSFGHQLHVYDVSGNEIGQVREKLFTLMPKFEIVIDNVVKGRILKEWTFFIPKYDIDFNGWHMEGDFFEWNYDVYENGAPIMHINKEWLAWGDTYVIDFNSAEYELMGIMLVVAIDAANCSKND